MMSKQLKDSLAAGDIRIGIMLSEIYVPNVTRILAKCGYDFILIDCEHGYFDMTQVANLVSVARGAEIPVLIRVTQPSRTVITKLLDLGANGILLSDVAGKEEAQRLVKICKYAPEGNRGLSTFRAHTDYCKGKLTDVMRTANDSMIVICQIESPDTVENIDDITAIPGVDGVLIGPNDLSQHMGITGQYDHPRMHSAIEKVAQSARKNGKWSGIITANDHLLSYGTAQGMTCFSVGSELNAIYDGGVKQLQKAEKTIGNIHTSVKNGFQITDALLARGGEVPFVNHQPLPRYALKDQDYGMTIGVAVTQKNTLYVCWVGGGDNSKAYFLVSRSTDGGKTFSEPIMVIDPHRDDLPCDRCTIVGTLFCDPQNRLWLFFNQNLLHYDGRSTDWYIRCDDPDAEQPVWSEPTYIWHGETLNKPIVKADGEWLLPISLWQRYHITPPLADCWKELDAYRMANIFSSRDAGQTWERKSGVNFPDSRFDEHMFVELSDGRLWMMARIRDGLMECFSEDGGATWTEPVRARIQSVSARFHLRRLKSGHILVIKHGPIPERAAERREQLTAFLSEDDGRTFPYSLMLDERFEISYPDADQAADGSLYITYDRNRAVDGEILLAHITEDDIRHGTLVSEGSFLKKIAIAPGKAPGKMA